MLQKSGQRKEDFLKVLQSRWVLPMVGNLLENGCVIVAGNIIENIVPEHKLAETIGDREVVIYDYGNSIIVPGFINLHTHLEHTELRQLAKESGFLEWLPTLMDAAALWSVDDRRASAALGVQESIRSGTTFVVDISYNGASAQPLAASGLRCLIGLEVFGLNEAMSEQQWCEWLDRRQNVLADQAVYHAQNEGLLAVTVAPHAPYTVCPALWQEAVKWSQKNKLPILCHLAESQAEYDWFKTEDTNLKNFLIYAFSKRIANFSQLYETHIQWKQNELSPTAHLYKRGLLTDNLIAAHAVHLDEADINLLKSSQVAIAHCPHSNTTLKCGIAPLKKMLLHDIKVGLGTDSVASSNNLDLLNEARFAINLHHKNGDFAELDSLKALELITIKAAVCLGMDHLIGSLEIGKLADIAVFNLPVNQDLNENTSSHDLCTFLVQGFCSLQTLLVDGKFILTLPNNG